MNKAEVLFDAITGLREELVEEALNHRFRRRVRWERYAGLAACLALAVCVGWFGLMIAGGGMGGAGKSSDNGFSASSSTGGEVSGDTAPPPLGSEAGDAPEAIPGDGENQESFQASVVEILEGYILVEPLEGEAVRGSADRIILHNEAIRDLPELQVGDLLRIDFNGDILETYPAQLGEVYSVALIE